ncbi:hypothetical protein Dimus_008245 [Dionaea muscipula]
MSVKEFYAKMTSDSFKKNDVVKSKVRGVEVEFDHEKLATIHGEEPKRYDYFEETLLTMCKPRREDGVWWIGSGDNRRRDEEVEAPEEDTKRKKKEIRMTLIGKSSSMRQQQG